MLHAKNLLLLGCCERQTNRRHDGVKTLNMDTHVDQDEEIT